MYLLCPCRVLVLTFAKIGICVFCCQVVLVLTLQATLIAFFICLPF